MNKTDAKDQDSVVGVLSPEKERVFIEKNDVDSLRVYIQQHGLDGENICAVIMNNVPEDIIEDLIKRSEDVPLSAQKALLQQHSYKLLKLCATSQKLSDAILKEVLMYGDDSLLEFYIEKHPLSSEMQQWLIRAHRLNLIQIYIEKHGFCKEAQSVFLEFMRERLKR